MRCHLTPGKWGWKPRVPAQPSRSWGRPPAAGQGPEHRLVFSVFSERSASSLFLRPVAISWWINLSDLLSKEGKDAVL